MGVEDVWLIVPVAGLVIIIALIVTIIIVCRQRRKSNDDSSDIELQSRSSRSSRSSKSSRSSRSHRTRSGRASRAARSNRSYQDQESIYNGGTQISSQDRQDSIRVTARRLPDPPDEGQTSPPPDVISGGGSTMRKDDAGTYAMLGGGGLTTPLIEPDVTVMESPYAEGRGILGPSEILPPSDKETGEPVEETNVVYSTINQEEKQKSRKLKEERLSVAKQEEDGIRGKVD